MSGAEGPAPEKARDEARDAIPQVAMAVQILGLLLLGGIAGASAWTGNPVDRWIVLSIVGIAIGARPETVIQVFRKGGGRW